MAKSATLNPASMPFFPGGQRASEDDGGPGSGFMTHAAAREQDQSSSPFTFSSSPSLYRGIRLSPPIAEGHDAAHDAGVRFQQSPPGPEWLRSSPAPRSVDSDKQVSAFESRAGRDLANFDAFATVDDHGASGTISSENGALANSILHRQGVATPSISLHSNSRSPLGNNNVVVTSSSPVSSLDSGSHFASSMELRHSSFEAQLRASPIINDILDRLVRCEFSTREIHRDLGDVHRKVDVLLERSFGQTSQPEFKDPFAPSTPSQGLSISAPRPSVSGLAPNQTSDDITQISQRLSTLTTSVGQLLALQTQQHIQNTTPGLGNNLVNIGTQPIDIAPNQLLSPPLSVSGGILGHSLPHRPDLRGSSRTPNPPMRTWSAGSLDLPVRPPDVSVSLARPDILRDKRRSVSGMMRRDSANVDMLQGGLSRDTAGPTLSKWDQLPLAPELLRSLTKFGVGPPNKIQQRALPFLLRGSDIIAQAPPTQERIAAYVIPAIHVALVNTIGRAPHRGPLVVMISTTVDQATQAQRMIRDLGGPVGIRSALGVGSPNNDISQELRLLQQNMPHIICGTPQKLHALFTAQGGLVGSQVRFLVLDEVDQLIARNLHDFIFNIVKLLPSPRRLSGSGGSTGHLTSPSQTSLSTSLDSNGSSPAVRRLSSIGSLPNITDSANNLNQPIERQTALFSNTVPQDVLNLATAIQLREPVRVLVRRDGNVTHADTSQGARGLRQFYLYLAFTAGGRSESIPSTSGGGLGIIGSGRGGASTAETVQAREWKLDALGDLFEDIDVPQAIVHVGGVAALDAVVYKLASRGLDPVPLHSDMNAGSRMAALNKFRVSQGFARPLMAKVLVVYDVQLKGPEVTYIPLVINYDLPKAVEEYAHRVAPAIAPSHSRGGVIVNFVTATGGDVEMLRSIECFYKIKCPEVPMSLRDIV